AGQALRQAAGLGLPEASVAELERRIDADRRARLPGQAGSDRPPPPPPAPPAPPPSAPAVPASLMGAMQAMLALYAKGAHAKLAARARRLASRHPEQPEIFEFLAAACQALGRTGEAIEAARRVVALAPEDAGAASRLALLLDRGNATQAGDAAAPRARAQALVNRANAWAGKGKLEAAEQACREAIALAPEMAEAHSNLGSLLRRQNRMQEAEAAFRAAARLQPANAEIASNLAVALRDQNRLGEAEAVYRQAILLKPDYPDAHNNLGNVLLDQGRHAEALDAYRQAIALSPGFAEAHGNLGNALRELGRRAEAEAAFRHAIGLNPRLHGTHANLGNLLKDRGELVEAEACYRHAIALNPDFFIAHNNLGNVLMHQGRLVEAVEAFRSALAQSPDHVPTRGNLLFCLAHAQDAAPEAIFAEHLEFGRRLEARTTPRVHPPVAARAGGRPRIGFVSGDLRGHAVAHFVAPLWEILAARGYELFAYSNHSADDQVTARLRAATRGWARVAHWSDAELATRIAADRIDILFDLSGHTAFNRLSAFALKPAPVQVTWIGYPGTTGLSRMDYYIGNPQLTPPGMLDAQFTENIVCIPATTVFDPVVAAPEVAALPALGAGCFTFGSFNRIVKSGGPVLALWARVLHAVPGSRFLLGGMRDEAVRQDVLARFAREGIGPERVLLRPRAAIAEYLAYHNEVDLLLDSFPYAGATTTCFGLWMGVPTVTLAGRTVPARVGLSILGHVGMQDFIADSEDAYLGIATHWATHTGELAALRAGLRDRVAAGLRAPGRVADGLEQALLAMWRRHCEGLRPAAFEITAAGIAEKGGAVRAD
ncbi:MAG: tetratricopeptide repeat protein, partial [Acetobacteraceae bacterium]|nr:tetratricopeptide repeat protein [Acetobacteraceae bacterium]